MLGKCAIDIAKRLKGSHLNFVLNLCSRSAALRVFKSYEKENLISSLQPLMHAKLH
jgi:hypothetical protein